MHFRQIAPAFAIVALAAATSGCSSTTGTATTPSSAATPAGPGLPSAGAPNVASPLTNTTAVESDPCSAVTQAQVENLGTKVSKATPESDQTGKSCVWTYDGQYGTINAGLTPGNKDGLSSLYASSKDGTLTSFNSLPPINGYPAVTYAQGGEGEGVCTLAVGVRNDLLYTVIARLDTDNPHRNDPCGVATKIAEFAIQHLKGA